MSHVKRGNKRLLRRKKILSLTKGFFGFKKNLYRYAREAASRALLFAYRDRRRRKRDFRKLWITRINAAARLHGLSYSQFMGGLRQQGIELNRKMLSEMAIHQPEAFKALAVRIRA